MNTLPTFCVILLLNSEGNEGEVDEFAERVDARTAKAHR